MIEISTVPTQGMRFSRLTPTARRSVVERWMGGRGLDRICGKVRNLVILGLYGDARAAKATGYVPVPLRPRFRDEGARV